MLNSNPNCNILHPSKDIIPVLPDSNLNPFENHSNKEEVKENADAFVTSFPAASILQPISTNDDKYSAFRHAFSTGASSSECDTNIEPISIKVESKEEKCLLQTPSSDFFRMY